MCANTGSRPWFQLFSVCTEVASSYIKPRLNFLRSTIAVFYSIIFYLYQQCTKISIPPYLCQHLVFSIFNNSHHNKCKMAIQWFGYSSTHPFLILVLSDHIESLLCEKSKKKGNPHLLEVQGFIYEAKTLKLKILQTYLHLLLPNPTSQSPDLALQWLHIPLHASFPSSPPFIWKHLNWV